MENYLPKYFSENEFNSIGCSLSDLNPVSLQRLDAMRSHYGKPIHLTSAYRSRQSELDKGRSGTSAHCTGHAFDIKCTNSRDRYLLILSALTCGFSRIGIGRNFIHVDDSPDHTEKVVWHYYK